MDAGRVVFPEGSPQLNAITVVTVQPAGPLTVRLPGRVSWNEERTVRVVPAFAGRVTDIRARPGDSVRAGQVLATFASPDFASAQADAQAAETTAGFAEKALTRVRLLADHEVASRKELQSAEADAARAHSELDRARTRLAIYGGSAKIDATYTLRAPIAGTVVERNINPGQEFRPDSGAMLERPLFVVTDPDHLWLYLDATERDLRRLKVGEEVHFRTPAWPGETFNALVEQVSDFVDPDSRTIKVRCSLSNRDRRLKGEMFVNAELETSPREGVAVPGKAVFLLGDRHFVFVEEGKGRFMPLEVSTGPDTTDTVVVTQGLSSGQRVVVTGSLFLQQIIRTTQ
ncbi:MAG: efflux RND transporter periplasmic adaptor subunit [Betaproteobacteria bacterium]|nr:efflux RND transporter periplasmic adaptor subunit [Betaproteobacteria bacterium]